MARRTGLRASMAGAAVVMVASVPAGMAQDAAKPIPAPSANTVPTHTPADASAVRGFARRIPNVRGVAYAAEVAPGIYRGGKPTQEGVAWLKQLGIRTVINLRHYHGETERRWVESAGMRYERIKLESSDEPKPAQVARFLQLIRDPSLLPIYVHCLHGVDRTGAMMVVYRMEVSGWSNADAIAEMDHFGPHVIWRDLRRFVRRYQLKPHPTPGP